jgi:lipopolysaccharide export system permease protein
MKKRADTARPVGREVGMFGTILFRMILWELVKVFLISLLGITGILLMASLIAEASQQGLGPGQVLTAIPLLIPCMLPYTVPATTLFAACVVYGRLSADNEIQAIKSAGVNILKVVKPGVILGLAMSAVTLGLYYDAIPRTLRLLRAMVFRDAEEFMYSLLKRQGMINHPQLPYSLFVQAVRGKQLMGPVVKHKDSQGKIDAVATAQEAELRVDMVRKMLFIRMKNGISSTSDGSRAYFQERTFDVPLPKDFGADNRSGPRGMTWPEVDDARVDLDVEIEKAGALHAVNAEQLFLSDMPVDFPPLFQGIRDHAKVFRQQQLALDVELHMRAALSLGCLFFILVGCPVGIWSSRGDYLSSFITCFLPIIVVYYPLILCGTGFAREGRYPMAPLVYGADIVLALMSLVLFWRLLKN